MGLDGTDYDFYAKKRFGSTWSPAGGVPFAMVKDGECLAQFVTIGDSARLKQLSKCLGINQTVSP